MKGVKTVFGVMMIIAIESYIGGLCTWALLHEKTVLAWRDRQIGRAKRIVRKAKKAYAEKKRNVCVKWLAELKLRVVPDETKR